MVTLRSGASSSSSASSSSAGNSASSSSSSSSSSNAALRRSKRKATLRSASEPSLKKLQKPPANVSGSSEMRENRHMAAFAAPSACSSPSNSIASTSKAKRIAKPNANANAKAKAKDGRRQSRAWTGSSSSTSSCLDLQQVRMGAREKERLVDQRLTLDVMQLKQEIQRYTMLKSLLLNRSAMLQQAKSVSLVRFVKCYYDTFRYGFYTPFAARKQLILKTCEFDQTQFLHSIMEPDVRWGRFCGIGVILDQWQRYANFFHYLSLTLVSVDIIDVDGLPIIKTRGDIFLRFTRNSVQEMFPHVIGSERLTQKLIGLHVKFRIGVDFFLNKEGRVVRFEAITHYFDAISHAFDDLSELCEVMSKAQISEEGCLGQVLTYPRIQENNQVDKTKDKPPSEMSIHFILS